MTIYSFSDDLNYLFFKSQKRAFFKKSNSAYRNLKRFIARLIRKLKGEDFVIRSNEFLITKNEIYLGNFPLTDFATRRGK